jgi:hypothetical protein
VNYSCHCIDDFAMPFTGYNEPPMLVHPEMNEIVYVSFYKQPQLFVSSILFAQRGPPVFHS